MSEKLPIAAIIQLIGQYSIDEYNDYVEQCKADYAEYVPHSDYEERHRRGVILSAARRLVDIRWAMPGVFETDDQPAISKYAVKVTFPKNNLVLYIHRDPDSPDQPMYLGFGWETTSRVSEAWTTPNEKEARILLGRWRRTMIRAFDGEGAVVVIDDQPTEGEV